MAAPVGVGASPSVHLVDELESTFQNCYAAITSQEHFNTNDSEEIKTGVEQSIQKFLDVAKQLESFFLQKRLLLSIHRPEQILKEENNELKLELQRKDQLIQKHYEKLQHWQNMLRGVQGGKYGPGGPQGNVSGPGGPQMPPGPPPSGPPSQGGPPQSHSQHPALQQAQTPQQQQAPPPQAMPPPPTQPQYPQGPLAFLEQTTSSIGLPERR